MENINAIQVANSPAVWALCAIAVIAVIAQTILFIRLAYSAVKKGEVKLTTKQCNRALKAGVVSAIGPAFGVFVVMIGLVAILGGPMAWLRLSVIGGATTELLASSIGVSAAGGDINETLSLLEMSTAWWTMSINACGWLVMTWLFASRMEKVRTKIGGGDSRWIELFSSAATLGIFGAFCSEYIVLGLQNMDYKTLIAIAVSGAAMWTCMVISNKYKWLKEYSLGVSMILGIAAAIIF